MGFLVKFVLVLAVVAGGVWAYMTFMMPTPAPVEAAPQVQEQTPPQAQQPAIDDGGISTSGTSDAALSADLDAFDSQVQSAQNASADVDSSFNDQPIQQTE